MALDIVPARQGQSLLLSETDQDSISQMLQRGRRSVRTINRAHILRLSDEGLTAVEIAGVIHTSTSTIYRVRSQYRKEGLEKTLTELRRLGRPVERTKLFEGQVIALYCRDPPEGYVRWTFDLLLREGRRLFGWTLSRATVHRVTTNHHIKPWKWEMWCIAILTPEYLQQMTTVLELYAKPYNPAYPVICVDEKMVELQANLLPPDPQGLSHGYRQDSQYQRFGSLNAFVAVEPKTGQRFIQLTNQRRKIDFAFFVQFLVEQYLADTRVEKIQIVCDNLNTHNSESLYAHLSPEVARKLDEVIIWTYTPVHGSWLNLAENEIGVWVRQCLGRRFPDIPRLVRTTHAWVNDRNGEGITLGWTFTPEEAKQLVEVQHFVKQVEQDVMCVDPDYEDIYEAKLQVHQALSSHQEQHREKRKKKLAEVEPPHLARLSPSVTTVKDQLVDLDSKNEFPNASETLRPVGKQRKVVRKLRPLLLAFLTSTYPLSPSVRHLAEELRFRRGTVEHHLRRLIKEKLVVKIDLVPTKKNRARSGYLLATPPQSKGPPTNLGE